MPRWTIDWRIEGTYETEAATAEEAQDKFDKDWTRPSGVNPLRDGEASNDAPVLAARSKPEDR